MAYIEQAAHNRGFASLTVSSFVTAERFSAKVGFMAVRNNYHGDERVIIMEQDLKLSRNS